MIRRIREFLGRKQLPKDFPNEEDLEIASIEWEQTGSLLAVLRAVAEWRREN